MGLEIRIPSLAPTLGIVGASGKSGTISILFLAFNHENGMIERRALISVTTDPRVGLSDGLRKMVKNFLRSQSVEGNTPRTIGTYEQRLRLFVDYLEEQDVTEVTHFDVLGYLETLKSRDLSPRTIQGQYGAIYTFYEWAVKWELVARNPVKLLNRPRAPSKPKPFLSKYDFLAMLDECAPNTFMGDRRLAVLHLLLTSGIRLNELVMLRQDDLNWSASRIKILHGKGDKERMAPFHMDAQRAILRYLGHRTDDCPELWVTEGRRPLGYAGMANDIKRVRAWAGVTVRDQTHVFRRTFADNLLENNVRREYVQALGGWETPNMLDQYVSWRKSEQGKALDAVKDIDPWK